MTQTKLSKIPTKEMFWRYNAGTTWNSVIEEYCRKHKIPAVNDTTQTYDLYIWTPRATYGIELKGTDMHSSLFPKKTETGLEREFKGDKALGLVGYLDLGVDHVILVYAHKGMDEKDLVGLDRIMFKFPTIRRKSYITQENAVAGIYRMVRDGIQKTNLSEPSYFSSDLGNTLARQLERIPGVSAENALRLSELLDYDPCNIYHIDSSDIINIFREIFPDNKNGEHHHMVYVLYDYYRGGVEPLKNKKLVSK